MPARRSNGALAAHYRYATRFQIALQTPHKPPKFQRGEYVRANGRDVLITGHSERMGRWWYHLSNRYIVPESAVTPCMAIVMP